MWALLLAPALLLCAACGRAQPVLFHYNDTYKFDVTYSVLVSKTNEYILEFGGDDEQYITPARVTVASEVANRTYPVFITARQQKGVLTWQLPTTVATPSSIEEFNNISRTLCPHNNLFREEVESCDVSSLNTPIVHISTSSPYEILVEIHVSTVKDFYVKFNADINNDNMNSLNHTYNFTITPSEPTYYFFAFHQDDKLDLDLAKAKNKLMCNEDLTMSELLKLGLTDGRKNGLPELTGQSYGLPEVSRQSFGSKIWQWDKMPDKGGNDWFSRPKSVILMIESDDDICAVVSIQNFSCPVFDNERDILYDGYYLTMTKRGGITLTQEMYPIGFYIVFIVKSSDEDCMEKVTGASNLTTGLESYLNWQHSETVDVVTKDGRAKSFRFAIVATISYQEYIIAGSLVFVFFLSFYFAHLAVILCVGGKKPGGALAGEDNSGNDESIVAPATPHDESSSSVLIPGGQENVQDIMSESAARRSDRTVTECSSSSDCDSEYSTLADVDTEKDIYRLPARLCLASLSRKKPRVLRARSNLYLWNLMTVVVFYTLPVVQLVVTYQRLLKQSGNQDLCYYNFLCAHPLGLLSDFNHVYSNLGYVMLGVLFLIQVMRRHRRSKLSSQQQKDTGIPQHYGLFYAMGIALISEGLLSGSYHVCPNDMNFQFDTSFMYVTGVLCMVKIYQSRHPDINARAHATYGVLALIIFIGLVGVLNASVYFWISFTILHLTTCFVLTFQIYYMGRFKFDGGLLCRAGRELITTPRRAITPAYCGRMVLLVIANVANWALAGYGMYQHQRDFASHLLAILMGNLFLYTNFYVVMKLLHRERIKWHSWTFVVLTHACWYTAAYFFLQQSTSWALTPAQSRQYNRMCQLLNFFDSHDIWHFLSAVAMFFSFNMYLTIDDGLSDTPRTDIMVF